MITNQIVKTLIIFVNGKEKKKNVDVLLKMGLKLGEFFVETVVTIKKIAMHILIIVIGVNEK